MSNSESSVIEIADQLCVICLSNKTQQEILGLDCGHSFCFECMAQYLQIKIIDGVYSFKCPDERCTSTISEEMVILILPPSIIEKWRTFQKIKSNLNMRQCPFCYEYQEGSPNRPMMKCCICKKEFCYYHSNAHNSTIKCKEYEKSQEQTSKQLIDKEYKHCPGCGAITDKTEGCNHMRCSYCHVEWCWLCESKLLFKGTFPIHYSWWNLYGCHNAY